MNYLRNIQKAATLNLLVQVFSNFGLGFASYFFKIQGLPFYKIMIIWALGPLVSLPVVRFINTWNVRRCLQLGVLAYTGLSLSLLFYNRYSYLVYGFFEGCRLGFFWVSLNYLFFLRSTNQTHAKNSAVYFILGPLADIILPPLGALVIDGFGYQALFMLTGLLSFVPLLYIRGEAFNHVPIRSWQEAGRTFSGLRLMTFFDGALHFFQGNFLMIYALLFLKTEYQVGGFLSYLALLSLVVSLALAHVSDKSQKRVALLYPLLIGMSVLIMLMPVFKTPSVFVAAVGLYAIFDNLSLPIRFAVPMDFVKTDIGFWRASEFYGNLGRTVVFALAALLLYLDNYWAAFAIFALMTLLFPFIISWKVKTHFKLQTLP